MLKAVRIVLVRPIYSGNIGAVCRVMANMGLSELVLQAPGSATEQRGRWPRRAGYFGRLPAGADCPPL